jgi:transposase
MKVASNPNDLVEALKNPAWNLARLGLEAGPLHDGCSVVWREPDYLQSASKPVMRRRFSRRRSTRPTHDARGIAQMMRVDLFRPVHVKTLLSQNRRALLTPASCFRKRPSPLRTTSVA